MIIILSPLWRLKDWKYSEFFLSTKTLLMCIFLHIAYNENLEWKGNWEFELHTWFTICFHFPKISYLVKKYIFFL